MLLWIIATGGALVGIMALVAVRRLQRKLANLTQSYWELRYEYTQLRSELRRLDPTRGDGDRQNEAPPREVPGISFVPLSSLKK
jgi:Tfp pilus assembly protein PilN